MHAGQCKVFKTYVNEISMVKTVIEAVRQDMIPYSSPDRHNRQKV